MRTRLSLELAIVLIFMIFSICPLANAGELHPLNPKGSERQNLNKDRLHNLSQLTDEWYSVQHVDENAEYYLGSGAADDTFFITFEPPAACSVKYVEIQWFDSGNILAFAAWYSNAAHVMFPDGTAPDRGSSPVSPIGDWVAGPLPNATSGNQSWELLDLGGVEWVVGDPMTLESDIFGIGYIKGSDQPHPLADRMDSKGIRYSYTWFGGPWMSTYPYPWGAYSSDLSGGTVVDVMMRVWVCYPWGMPILITNLNQLPNTFGTYFPYTVTCNLEDDNPGITGDDTIELMYTVNGGAAAAVDLVETVPGSDMFTADIPAQPVGSLIDYWIECVDDVGLESNTFPKSFEVFQPVNYDADLLLVNDGMDDRATAYYSALDQLGIYYEEWNVDANNGIDESVLTFGWGSVLVAGWGVTSIPCLDEENPYDDFLDMGGNLALWDQDWFYAQGLPAEGNFVAGDFAYEYLGISDYWNDYDVPDINYYGSGGDPITHPWDYNPYETYWDESGIHMQSNDLWADWFTEGAAENIFWGENDGYSYGCRFDNGYKTMFLSFMPEANCEIDTGGNWVSSADFTALIGNTLDWFQVAGGGPTGWELQITATGEVGTAPNEFNVIIGGDDNQNFLPAPPPPPQYMTWPQLWELPAWNGPYSEMIQVWDEMNEYEWTLELDPNGNVMPPISRTTILSWNPATLPETPENWGFFIVDDGGNLVVQDMSQQSSFEVTGESTVFLHIKYAQMILPFEYNLNQYWNLISLPVTREDNSLASLFPNATVAYEFSGGTYIQADSLDNGKAYWLYVPNAETLIVEGLPFTEYSVQVTPPWEMLGSVSEPAVPTVDPGNIVVMYNFDQTYYQVPGFVMEPGFGYWVNMTGDAEEFSLSGTLFDGSAKVEETEMVKETTSLDDWELALNLNNDANSFNLSIGSSENADNTPAPPAPPQYSVWGELYEADCSSGPYFSMIQPSGTDISTWLITIDPNGNANPQASGLAVLSWDAGSIPAQGLLSLVNSNGGVVIEDMRDVESFEINGSEVVHYEIVFNTTLGIGSPDDALPADYTLYQNTPNPFNPVTQIKYYLLDNGDVKVTVFNIKGEEVAILVDGVQNQGFHVVNFDAANLTSGVYFYRIEAGDFTDWKKMVLIK